MKAYRAQSAMELLFIIAIGLVLLTGILYISQKRVAMGSEQINNERAVIAIEELVDAAELVHSQGSDATTQRYIVIPDNSNEIKFNGSTISLILDSGNVVSRNTGFNVSGSIRDKTGAQYVIVKSLSDGSVNFTSAL